MKELKQYCKDFLSKHPQFTDNVEQLFDLYEMEVEDGNSEIEERHKCISDIDDLLNEN